MCSCACTYVWSGWLGPDPRLDLSPGKTQKKFRRSVGQVYGFVQGVCVCVCVCVCVRVCVCVSLSHSHIDVSVISVLAVCDRRLQGSNAWQTRGNGAGSPWLSSDVLRVRPTERAGRGRASRGFTVSTRQTLRKRRVLCASDAAPCGQSAAVLKLVCVRLMRLVECVCVCVGW